MPPERSDAPATGHDPNAGEAILTRPDVLVDLAAGALAQREQELHAEQAVHGLDALDELKFHPLLAAGFSRAGLGVVREALFPGEVLAAAKRRAKRAERERCDLVLLPHPAAKLLDPVAAHVERDELENSLFAPVAETILAQPQGVAPGDALWVEVKVVGQFCFTDGWSGPNRSYSSELTRALGDLEKLARDPHISRGALMLVLFTIDQTVADHDLRLLWDRAAERHTPMLSPSIARVPIVDRIGNRLCTLAWIPARCVHEDADQTPAL